MKRFFVSILLLLYFLLSIPIKSYREIELSGNDSIALSLGDIDSSDLQLSQALQEQHNNYLKKVYALLSFIIILIIIAIIISIWLNYKKQIVALSSKKDKTHDPKNNSPNHSNKKLNQEDNDLFIALEDLMIKEKIFTDPNLTLNSLAKRVSISRNQLSYMINRHTGRNFNYYINEFRIKEIIRIISNPEYNHMNMEEIAEQGGFNSRSAFYSAFKTHTGLTPTQFKHKNLP